MHATGAMLLRSFPVHRHSCGDHFAFHLVHFAFLERMQFCFARWVCQKNSRHVCVLIIDARQAGGFHLCCYPFSSIHATFVRLTRMCDVKVMSARAARARLGMLIF